MEKYKQKKNQLVEKKADLKQKIKDFGRKGPPAGGWLEPMRNFILAAHQAKNIAETENLKPRFQRGQKIGSNWQIKDKKIRFEAQNE